jgi:endonuclease/exonuclease/phosphatase family metal-dependent hydrolase
MTERALRVADGQAVLRVLTFNLLSSDHADWERRHEVARPQLRERGPDVVVLQETTVGTGVEQATELLGSGYHVTDLPTRPGDSVGAVLASRWPFRDLRKVDLRVPPRVPSAAALVAEVELPAPFGPSLFIHHSAAYQFGYAREREVQAVTCARFVEDHMAGRDAHAVLLGDFNDTPDSSSLRFWTGRQSLEGFCVAYQDAWEAVHPGSAGHTFSPENPLVSAGQMPLEVGRRIDYILVRSGNHGPSLEIADCRQVCNAPINGVWASDHFGLMADLRVPVHPPGPRT